jgi:DNA helicase-2/ATP-dependent DNA helicase PcrA
MQHVDVVYNHRVDTADLMSTKAGEPSGRFSARGLGRELNPPQIEAVLYPPQPLLVIAGAGSGKTRVITYRLAHLLSEGTAASRILAVTFTNKAARELKERVERLFGGHGQGTHGMWLGTFHGIAARLLRRFGEAVGVRKDFVIYDEDDARRLMARVLADMKVADKSFPVRQVMAIIDRAKNQGTTADRFPSGDYFDEVVGKAYRLYEERLSAANAVDFGGLLLTALNLCKADCAAAPALAQLFDHVLVDEFQDTNNVQYRLVRFLSHRTGSITVVGDEDQSIYRWRGADIRNILDFERDHPGAGVIKLEQNYRSTNNILRTANAVIARNKERREKRLVTEQSAGAPNSWPPPSRAIWPGTPRLAISPCFTAPTPSRACSRRPCACATFPTSSWAVRASTIAPRSRTSCRTCACCKTPRTPSRFCASSTCPRAG